jgi:hypothetical protein
MYHPVGTNTLCYPSKYHAIFEFSGSYSCVAENSVLGFDIVLMGDHSSRIFQPLKMRISATATDTPNKIKYFAVTCHFLTHI